MAVTRICDRCGAAAAPGDLAHTTRTLMVPAAEPATQPVRVDYGIALGMELRGGDLCDICQVSALIEYALQQLAATITPVRLALWSARINAATGVRP